MTRNPDVPCADCGILMWRGRGCLPRGQARCMTCRRARPGEPKRATDCPVCGKRFISHRKSEGGFTQTCGLSCGQLYRPRTSMCACGQPVFRKGRCQTCARALAREGCQRRRAKKAGVEQRFYRRADVFAEHGHLCSICTDPIDSSLAWPHPMSPSIDHVVPIALGGGDTPENVRPAHLRCNQAKGARACA